MIGILLCCFVAWLLVEKIRGLITTALLSVALGIVIAAVIELVVYYLLLGELAAGEAFIRWLVVSVWYSALVLVLSLVFRWYKNKRSSPAQHSDQEHRVSKDQSDTTPVIDIGSCDDAREVLEELGVRDLNTEYLESVELSCQHCDWYDEYAEGVRFELEKRKYQ